MIASAKSVITLHNINPNNKVGNMIGYGIKYPNTCHPNDILKTWEEANEDYFIVMYKHEDITHVIN